MKKYRLLKDMPSTAGIIKAGAIFSEDGDMFRANNGNVGRYSPLYIEANPEFFEEVTGTMWKPKLNDIFFCILRLGEISYDCWLGTLNDEKEYDFGNCFKTKEQAEHARDEIKKLLLKLH